MCRLVPYAAERDTRLRDARTYTLCARCAERFDAVFARRIKAFIRRLIYASQRTAGAAREFSWPNDLISKREAQLSLAAAHVPVQCWRDKRAGRGIANPILDLNCCYRFFFFFFWEREKRMLIRTGEWRKAYWRSNGWELSAVSIGRSVLVKTFSWQSSIHRITKASIELTLERPAMHLWYSFRWGASR